jgi:hypothetical protein
MALTNSHPHRHDPTLDAQNTPQLYGRKHSGHTEPPTHMNGDLGPVNNNPYALQLGLRYMNDKPPGLTTLPQILLTITK